MERKNQLFSLCGLNCALCPRFHTEGVSLCPGCGGRDFHLAHPTCGVMTCNKKHDKIEFCFQCSLYPCQKYREMSDVDSFISYKKVLDDFAKVQAEGIDKYTKDLQRKLEILNFLLEKFNDGRRKAFYCVAVNLLDLADLEAIIQKIRSESGLQENAENNAVQRVVDLLEEVARKRNIELKLRKK